MVELLVSSEMLFLFLQSCCMCILGDQMLCLRYCFALCKINLFSVKPLWGFILVSSETMFWLLSFSEKQYVFDCVVVEYLRK